MHSIRSVIIADDVNDWVVLLEAHLERDGRFRVVGKAGHGADAVARAAEAHPDVAILDLAMPVMNGLDAIEPIRRVSPGTKVLIVSALGSGRSEDALAHGADAFVSKRLGALQEVADTAAALCEQR